MGPRARHLRRSRSRGGKPKRVAKIGSQPHFGRDGDRIFFVGRWRGGQASAQIGLARPATDEVTHLISAQCRRFPFRPTSSSSPGPSATRPMSCRSSAPAARSRSGPKARRCRSRGSAPTPATGSTGRATAASFTGARAPTCTSRRLAGPGAFAGGKTGQGAGRRASRLHRAAGPADRPHRAHQRAHRHHASGDEVIENGTVVINGDRIEAVGPARRSRSLPERGPIDVTGKTIIPGLIDAHWHGSHGLGPGRPRAELVPRSSLALRRDHGPRPVQRHVRSVRRERISESRARSSARASFRPAPSSMARRRRSRSRSRRSTMRARTCAGCKAVGRLVGQKLQPAAPRAAPDDHRGGARTGHGSRARRRVAVRDEHDHDRRRPHDHRTFASGRENL